MTKMVKYLVELPDSFDVGEMKLSGFTLADRERARRELQKTLALDVRGVNQALTDEVEQELNGQKLKLNSVRTKEEAIAELRRTEALLTRRARNRR